ncbi:MAG: citrate synthase, partial [Planctomycetota bacterium]|nr:citrate synthase [Planctomycetota bacterium]
KEGKLAYRGYPIEDLAENSTFEETAYLLWHGELPQKGQLEVLNDDLVKARALPGALIDLIRTYPKGVPPLDVVRTVVSVIARDDPDLTDNSPEANLRKATRLVSQIGSVVGNYARIRDGNDPVEPDPELSHAANLILLMTGEAPDEETARVLDVALILHADHGLNASTFAARVTTATLSDIHSAVISAIGTLKGPLHGGANRRVMETLISIGDVADVEEYVKAALARKEKIMGLGHRVYKTLDPRAAILRKMARNLGEKLGETKWIDMSEKLAEIALREKGLYPNVDFYSASAYYSLNIPTELYPAIFAVSRVAGWTAHMMEQNSDNRLIRPLARYVGPNPRSYAAMDQR